MKDLKEKRKNTIDLVNWLSQHEFIELGEIINNVPKENLPVVKDIIAQELNVDIFDKSIRDNPDTNVDKIKEKWKENKQVIINKINYLTSTPMLLNSSYDNVIAFKDITETIVKAIFALFAMIYIVSITLSDIPDDNKRFVDVILGFILSILGHILGKGAEIYKGHKEKK
jgi:NAD-specific glutamate dehydrogenase